MVKVVLVGARGKMGQVVSRMAAESEELQIVAGLDRTAAGDGPYPIYSDPAAITEAFDVILDFSSAGGLGNSLGLALARRRPVILAATGYSPEQLAQVDRASGEIPVFRSANLSLGINLLLELIHKAASVLGGDFDIEIIERHHNQKLDAPSGTALMIANTIAEALPQQPELVYDRHPLHQKRSRGEIGIHAVRGGTIVGEHEILFAGQDETLSITHAAQSKEIFAVGALKACVYMAGKPAGMYNMQNLVADTLA